MYVKNKNLYAKIIKHLYVKINCFLMLQNGRRFM